MTTIKNLAEINSTNMSKAEKSIIDMVNGRGLILSGKLDLSAPLSFPSKTRNKEFRKRLGGVIEHPSMKRVSMFLRMYSQLSGTELVKIDFSEKEKKIREYRKAYVEARKKAIEAQARYKEEKGDFYKSIRLKVND